MFVLLLSTAGSLVAQYHSFNNVRNDPYTKFYAFDRQLGKNPGLVIDIFQDKTGFIWLSSTNGLYRYDGAEVIKYVNDWTPNSLPSSHVNCVAQDSLNRLLVCTANGFSQYDYSDNSFNRIIGGNDQDIKSDTFYFNEIFIDGDSLIWLNAINGWLWKIDQKTLRVSGQIRHESNFQPYYYYQEIARDPEGRLWFGGRGEGPVLMDESDGVDLRLISSGVFVPGSDIYTEEFNRINSDLAYLKTDKNNNTWLGAVDGVFLLDTDSLKLTLVSKTSSWDMEESSNGMLFFGTSYGLIQYDPATKKSVLFQPDEENSFSVPGNYIYDIFIDSYNKVWVATSDGLSFFIPETEGLEYLKHLPCLDETPASSVITNIITDKSKNVWIATANKGIDLFDPETRQFIHFNTESVKGMPSDKIRCLLPGNNNEMYCGLWAGKGFGKLNFKRSDFELYTFNTGNTHYDWYNDMVFDHNGKLYLGFWGGNGLTPFDTSGNVFLPHLKNKFQLIVKSRLITTLCVDRKNRIWLGTTSGGLHVYLPVKDTSICYLSALNPENGFMSESIYDIHEDKKGNIWVGANAVFIKRDTSESFEKINLPFDIKVYKIFETEKEFWFLTNMGAVSYNPAWGTITDYSNRIPLTFDQVSAEIVEIDDGRLILGGSNGLVILDPVRVSTEIMKPGVFISSFSVFDKTKASGVGNNDTLHLKHDENFFTVNIGSDAWKESDPFRYFYKLFGFNEDWIEMKPVDRVARFTNVPSGNYKFAVKLEDPAGNEFVDQATCYLSISPPFYQKWWFAGSITLLFLSALFFFWWNRARNLRLTLDNADLNQKLLRLQMNPHFIFNSLFAIQSYIYTRQAHLASDYLSDFARLIRLILNNSRFEFIPISKELETIKLYLKLQQLRFENKFNYNIEVEEELIEDDFSIPPMLVQPFLENAIEHGLKHLKKEGELTLSYRLNKNNVEVEVNDNGIGLTASKKINENTEDQHESLAISICRKRLEILKQKGAKEIDFEIIEKTNDHGLVEGTRVLFKIPYTVS